MTANHAHTPSTQDVQWAAITTTFEDSSITEGAFNRWLDARDARIEAAAEQRGADKTRVIIARKLKAEDPEAKINMAGSRLDIKAWYWVAAQKDYIEKELPTFQNLPDRLEGDDE